MGRTYKRDSQGRFAGGGGSSGGKGGGGSRPPAKPVQRSTNRITRDNAGKITSVGGQGATARGGRLKTASGNQRATQTAKGIKRSSPTGAIRKTDVVKARTYNAISKNIEARNKNGTNKPVRETQNSTTRQAAAAKRVATQKRAANKPPAGSQAANKIEQAKGRAAQMTLQKAALNKQLKDINAKIKEAGPNAGAYRLQKIELQSRLQQTSRDLTQAKSASQTGNGATKSKSKRRQITDQKTAAISARVNNVTTSAGSKTGVKKLNSIEVGQRAKAFLARKAGGMSGLVGMNYKQQQATIKAALNKPTKYSTQRANRNKPGAYNNLGQNTIRRKQQAASSIERNNRQNGAARDVAQSIRSAANKQAKNAADSQSSRPKLASKSTGAKAPDNDRTRANRLRTMQNRVQKYSNDPDSKAFKDSIKSRNAALAARAKGTGGRVNFRSKGQAVSRQNYRANEVTGRVKSNMRMFGAKPGNFSKQTGAANGTGIKRYDTGMRQSSLFGPATKLYGTKTVQVKRNSGKRKR